jgi:hypothetical protein
VRFRAAVFQIEQPHPGGLKLPAAPGKNSIEGEVKGLHILLASFSN